MSIERERYDGPIAFICDSKRCPEVLETHATNFEGALAKAKSRGWKVRKRGSEWIHLCPDCES